MKSRTDGATISFFALLVFTMIMAGLLTYAPQLASGDTSDAFQTALDTNNDIVREGGATTVFILVQSTIRDSEGRLVAYLESTKFAYLDRPALEVFLDHEVTNSGNDPIITIDDKQYQVVRRVLHQTFDSDGLVASTKLSDKVGEIPRLLARFAHDGYPVTTGDTLESMWTFVRTVPSG